jgi:hypothetical protein
MLDVSIHDVFALLILAVIIGIPIWLTFFLRKVIPVKLWLGLLLSFFFFPFGHFYLKGGVVYIILLFAVEILLSFFISSEVVLGLVGAALSVALMYTRFHLKGIRNIEVGS